jgi:hypothetical protein
VRRGAPAFTGKIVSWCWPLRSDDPVDSYLPATLLFRCSTISRRIGNMHFAQNLALGRAIVYAQFSIGYTRIEDIDRVLACAGLELIGIPRAPCDPSRYRNYFSGIVLITRRTLNPQTIYPVQPSQARSMEVDRVRGVHGCRPSALISATAPSYSMKDFGQPAVASRNRRVAPSLSARWSANSPV